MLFLALIAVSGTAGAQEVRYFWFDMSYLHQESSRTGSFTDPLLNQTVSIDTSDGNGIRFRGSVGTWNNFYGIFDFASSDIHVDALVSNDQGDFPAEDEFDLTVMRGGVGLKYSLRFSTDLFAEVTLDSLDYDFGSFAGENFDVDEQDIGGAVGVRSMISDRIELRAHARYTSVGNADLSTREFESDTLFGAGFSIMLIRGLSLIGDFETGEIETWSIGFRLDLDED